MATKDFDGTIGPRLLPGRPTARGRRFRLPKPWRGWVERRRSLAVSAAIFATLLVLLSPYSGLVRAGSPTQVIFLSGLAPKTLAIGQSGTLTLTINGGYVDQTHPYTVIWFEGKSNATSVYAITQHVKPNSHCTNQANNCLYNTTTSQSVSYGIPGSFMVSVTVNDSRNDYTIATDLVTVKTSVSLSCMDAVGPGGNPDSNPYNVGMPITFSANATPNPSITYLWDFGDGTHANGTWMDEGALSPGMCPVQVGTHTGIFGVVHTYAAPGNYVVTVTASNGYGAADRRYIAPLVVGDPLPVLYDVHIPTIGYKSSPTFYFANVSDDNPLDHSQIVFAWNFSDGTPWQFSHPVKYADPNGNYATETSHVFNTTGNHTVWVEVFNEYGNVTLHPTQTAGPQSWKGYTVVQNPLLGGCSGGPSPITSVVTIGINGCGGVSRWSTAYNGTWLEPTGKQYGLTGFVRSYTYGSVPVPVYLNTSTGGTLGHSTATATFTDVAPIVGVTSMTVTPTITLSVSGTYGPQTGGCLYTSIAATLYNGTSPVASASLPCGLRSVPLGPVVPLYLGNAYSVTTVYNGVGGTGSTNAALTFVFAGNTTGSRQTTWTFNNANPSTWTWSTDVNQLSDGEPVTIGTTIFSFADVPLTTKWTFGDGGSTQIVSPAPSVYGPNRIVVMSVTHTWRAGVNYDLLVQTTDPVVGGQGGLTGQEALQLIELGDLSVNDTAPQAAITAPATTPEAGATPVSATLLQADGTAGTTTVTWYFGDGATATGTNATHNYLVAGVYPVVAVTSTPHHSASANLVWIRVSPAPVFPSINCTTATPQTFVTFSCSATNSSLGSGSMALAGLSWNFGDGTTLGGPVNLTGVVQHAYMTSGTDTINLTIQSADGRASSETIRVTISPVVFWIPIFTPPPIVDVRHASAISPPWNVLCGGFNGPCHNYFWNVTWNWGGGWPTPNGLNPAANEYGPQEGVTYAIPGKYAQNATVENVVNGSFTTESLPLTVVDYPVTISLPYQGAEIYGENHSVTFTGKALGGYYDNWVGPPGQKWNYTWSWGDGSAIDTPSSTANQSSKIHWYNTTGPENLSLTVTSPEPAAYRTSGTGTAQLNTVLDSDGDGLPNAYEALVTNTSAWYADTADKTGSFGTGLTDFQAGALNGYLSNWSADNDGDGLTNLQGLEGSVTGYPSNPLDANTAGDGIPDGGHFFTDSFRATNVVNLPSGAHWTNVTIPDAGYGGSTIAFNQSKLVVQFATNTLSAIQLEVILGDNVSFGLPAPTNLTDTYYLLNASPVLGVWGNNHNGVVLSISNLNVIAEWTLAIMTTSAFTGGSVPAAYVQDSYYTNPSLADPYHQGMLEGSSLTVPVFNCSAPATENYTIFNATKLAIVHQPYWPYTEQYWKLSKVQGIPYSPGTNATLTSTNNASTCGSSVSSSHFHDVATYLGDADFGISPWNVHASGDLALTNGMKALGASSYNATAWKYENTQGQMIALSGPDPYPADRISYTSPLNPTKVSSADDGVPDSQTPYPVAPLVLGVTITSATDPACITSPFLSPFTDTVGVNLAGQSGPTVYTPGVDGSGGSSSVNCWAPYAQNMQFTYHDSYTIPLNDSQSSFSVNFTLYHNDLGSSQIDGQPLTLTGLLQYRPGVVYYSAPGAYLNVSAQVLPMGRVNTILSNTTEELSHLPGYGLRYTGEQEFYAFYVNLGSNAPAPFVAGTNLILESRKAFLASPASAILANATTQFSGSKLSCLGNATVTSRTTNSTPSETGIAGTFSIDLSSDPSCATTLLMELSARNATGVTVGQNRTLSSTQIALLGLSTQVAQVAAYLPPVGFNSDPGGGPSGVLQSIVETATTYFVGALVAVGNFIASVAKDMVALGQLILGAIAKALGAVAAATQAALSAIESVLNFVLLLGRALVGVLTSPLLAGASNLGTCTQAQLREINYETAHGKNLVQAETDVYQNFWGCIAGPIFWGAVVFFAAVAVVVAIIEGFTLGVGFLVGIALSLLITGLLTLVNHSNINTGPAKTTNLSGSRIMAFAEGFGNNTTGRPPSTNNSTLYRGYNDNNTTNCSWGNGGQSNLTGCTYAPGQGQIWSFLGGMLVLLLDYKGAKIGLQTLKSSLNTNNVVVKVFNWIGMALSVISIILDLAALVISPEPRFSAVGLSIGIAAIVMTLGSIAYQAAIPDPENPIEIEDGIGLGLSGASTAISMVMYVDGY